MRSKFCIIIFIGLVTLILLQCASGPPKVQLKQYEIVGIIEFDCPEDRELGEYVTQRFIDEARKHQGVIRIAELGTRKEVLKKVRHSRLTRDAYQAIGFEFDVYTVITGSVEAASILPDFSFNPFSKKLGVKAELSGAISAEMAETETGASIWSSSAEASEELGDVTMGAKSVVFDAENPDRAYVKLVERLVSAITRDFR